MKIKNGAAVLISSSGISVASVPPYRTIYDDPKGQFVAIKARTRAAQLSAEALLFKRHGMRPVCRVTIKAKML